MNLTITAQGAVSDAGASSAVATANTAAIQHCVDAVSAGGGGTVTVPPGVYVTGMIFLRDNVRLHLDPGSVLRASPRVEDHPKRTLSVDMDWNNGWHHKDRFHLIAAVGVRNVSITGTGTVDGNGPAFYPVNSDPLAWPMGYEDARRMCTMVQIENCQDVRVEDVTLTNVSFWTLHLQDSDRVVVRGVRIVNPHNAPNADGIDITGCHGVMISDCHIDTCDDAICLKTFPAGRTTEDVVVTNCILRTHCVGLKLGCIESFQDMRNITFSNCVIRNSHRAVGIYSSQGAVCENITITNIVCDTCVPLMYTRPIHIEAGRRKETGRAGTVRNVTITNLIAETTGRVLIAAVPGGTVEDITLRDITLRIVAVDDPAVRGATVGGSQFAVGSPWARVERAAVVADSVRNLTVENLQVQWPAGDTPARYRFPCKAANGTTERFKPADWSEGSPPAFAAVSVRNAHGGALRAALLEGFNGADAIVTTESTWPKARP